MKLRLSICAAFFICGSLSVVDGMRVCGRYGDYNKLDAMHRLLVCLITDKCEVDENITEPERLIRTAKQLIFDSNKNMHSFRQCGWNQIAAEFSTDFQRALNESHLFTSPITTFCLSKDEVCSLHKEFLYPVICLLEKKCDQQLAKLIYAFLYGLGQLNAETERPLKCDVTTDFDLTKDTILDTRFCNKFTNRKSKKRLFSNL
ncbi:hypothetical protein M3Y97_00540100 [Aphelenchoides bicaudatus]|nr:hypothetical protein M3Y97_00540100 [Aphelenchoides bicaudatus]